VQAGGLPVGNPEQPPEVADPLYVHTDDGDSVFSQAAHTHVETISIAVAREAPICLINFFFILFFVFVFYVLSLAHNSKMTFLPFF
jgi:hypothetical protein